MTNSRGVGILFLCGPWNWQCLFTLGFISIVTLFSEKNLFVGITSSIMESNSSVPKMLLVLHNNLTNRNRSLSNDEEENLEVYYCGHDRESCVLKHE